MSRANVIFAIVAPLILLVIVAVLIIVIGEVLLFVRAVGDEVTQHDHEIAALYPVVVALIMSAVFLIGGAIASRMAPPSRDH
ncbi:MAG: hypothetical protein U0821_09065 [Chloroflexota bacterium]